MKRPKRARPDRCAHERTIYATATGLERSVCEDCGRVSFSFASDVAGEVERFKFVRLANDSASVRNGGAPTKT